MKVHEQHDPNMQLLTLALPFLNYCHMVLIKADFFLLIADVLFMFFCLVSFKIWLLEIMLIIQNENQ